MQKKHCDICDKVIKYPVQIRPKGKNAMDVKIEEIDICKDCLTDQLNRMENAPSTDGQVERVVRRRPKTRGELIDCLKRGVECEIVASNEQTTNIVLDGWLNFAGKYKTRPSENVGWIIYVAA